MQCLFSYDLAVLHPCYRMEWFKQNAPDQVASIRGHLQDALAAKHTPSSAGVLPPPASKLPLPGGRRSMFRSSSGDIIRPEARDTGAEEMERYFTLVSDLQDVDDEDPLKWWAVSCRNNNFSNSF